MKIVTQENLAYVWSKLQRVLGEKASKEDLSNTQGLVPNRYTVNGNNIVAQHVEVVEDGSETITDLTSVDISEILTSNQIDWNENDESSPKYVQNRTHYIDAIPTTIIDTHNLPGNPDVLMQVNDGCVIIVIRAEEESELLAMNDGETYQFKCGDYVHGAVCSEIDAGGYMVKYIGNSYLAQMPDAVDNGLPYVIFQADVLGILGITISTEYIDTSAIDTDDIHSISPIIMSTITETIRALDEKYIPDTIARVEDTPLIVYGEWPVLEKSIMGDDGRIVSDSSYAEIREAIDNGRPVILYLYRNGSTVTLSDYVLSSYDHISFSAIYSDGAGTEIIIVNITPEDVMNAYTADLHDMVTSDWNAVSGEMGYIENKPTKLSEFIDDLSNDDWNQNNENTSDYIKNRTHYTVYPLSYESIYENNVSKLIEIDSSYGYFLAVEGDIPVLPIADNVILQPIYLTHGYYTEDAYDTTYEINESYVQDTAYQLLYDKAHAARDPYVIIIKDPSVPVTLETNSGTQSITFPNSGIWFYKSTGELWTIKKMWTESAAVVQLDEKYIPDTIARTSDIKEEVFNVNFTGISTTADGPSGISLSCDKTYAEVVEAYSSGKLVIGRCDICPELVFITRFNDTWVSFISDDVVKSQMYVEIQLNDIDESVLTNPITISDIVTDFQTKSDWNENDEYSAAYIQNRTHYEEDPAYVDIFNATAMNTDFSASGLSYGDEVVQQVGIRMDHTPAAGEKYKITINGTIYELIATDFDGTVTVGNYALSGTDGAVDTGENFVFAYFAMPYAELTLIGTGSCICRLFMTNSAILESNTISISVEQINVVQLPEKFISYKPGEVVTGKTFTVDGNEIVAGQCAEVFNDRESNVATGYYSHAEGCATIASEAQSHAEGYRTTASGWCSHAEGYQTIASGQQSHAEGYLNTTSGAYSHAEGCGSIASNYYSHAEGHMSIASSNCQHVQGKYNVEDTEDKYAHIVGNGGKWDSANRVYTRSNAHTLDWDGGAWYAKDIRFGGTSYDDAKTVMAAPSTAAVGQFIAVKAVDANNVPTDFEAIDVMTNNDIDAILGLTE